MHVLSDQSVHNQASTLTYFSTYPFGQLTKKSTCPTQSFSCPKKLIKISVSSQGDVGRLLGEVNCD
jgi:hypothetical protein